MKRFSRFLCCTVVLALLCSIWAVSGSAYENYEKLHVTNCKDWVSLREKPSTSSRCIMQLPLGALVSYVGDAGTFLRVSYSGTMGYVAKQYLRRRAEADAVPMYIANCKDWISLRKSASTSSARLAKIPLGAMVLSLDRHDSQSAMSKVRYNGKIGYVDPKYLCLLPPKADKCDIASATMHVPDASGKDYAQKVTEKKRLEALEALLRDAGPDVSGQCPNQALLVIQLTNGDTLRFMYPTDGCTAFFTTDHSVYAFPESKGDVIWKIFDKAASKKRS